jgi:hypothetical protein
MATAGRVFAAPFTAHLQGTLTQSPPDATGGVTLRVDTTLSDGAAGAFQVLLQGQQANDGGVAVSAGRVTLAGPGGSPRYQGALQGLQTDGAGARLRAMLPGPGGQVLMLQGTLQLTPDGRVGGVVQVTSD